MPHGGGGSVSPPQHHSKAQRRAAGIFQPQHLGRSHRMRGFHRHAAGIRPQSRLDEAIRQYRAHQRHQDRRGDHEIQIAHDGDLQGRVHRANGIIGHFDQQRIGRRDKDIDQKHCRHAGKARRQPRQRMPPQTVERRRRQGHQHQIARIRSNRGQNPHHHDHEGEQRFRRTRHQFAHHRGDQPGFLGQPHPDHRHHNHPDAGEAQEVHHRRGDHEPDAVAIQQAADRSPDLATPP